MDGPGSAQQLPSARLLLLPLFHEHPESAYSAIFPLFGSTSMTQFTQSVHILSDSIPSAIHVDPATVATAAEVSVLNDMMIDDPSVCAPLLNYISQSWRPESVGCTHVLQACRSLAYEWAHSPSLFEAAVVILANSASLEQWNCAQSCLSLMKFAAGCHVALITQVDFPSGPVRPSSGFVAPPTLAASLVLSPSLSLPPVDYLLSQPFTNTSNVVLSEIAAKHTIALGPVSTIQSGTFSGKVVTAYLPSSSDASHPLFSAIAAAAPGQLFPIALQIELHYQCRCTVRSTLLPSKLIKLWELPLFGFFSAGVHDCNHATGDFINAMPGCSAGAAHSGGGGVGNDSGSNSFIQEATGTNGHAHGNKLHFLTLRQTPSVSDSTLVFACHLFQRHLSLSSPSSDFGISAISEKKNFKLPLLGSNCISKLCHAPLLGDADASLGEEHDAQLDTEQPLPASNYVLVKQSTRPSFQVYESKFRFLDAQIPPALRPAAPCVFAVAVSAANAPTSHLQALDSDSFAVNPNAGVHPCSLSPTRGKNVDKQDKQANSSSGRLPKKPLKRSKTPDTTFLVPSGQASTTMKAVSDVIPGEGATFAQLLAASPSPFAADAASAAKKSAVTSASSHPVKSDQKSPAYELLKSKLWSKLHTKFRRETQPAVDIDLLKIVFNSMLRDWTPIVEKMGAEFSDERLDQLLQGCEHQASGMLKSEQVLQLQKKQKKRAAPQ